MCGKLISEPLNTAKTSLHSSKPKFSKETKFVKTFLPYKDKSKDLIEIEYNDPSSDLSEFRGVCIPKNFDFTIFCETGKFYIRKDEVDKIIECSYCRIKSDNPAFNLDKNPINFSKESKNLDNENFKNFDDLENETSEKLKFFNISDISYIPECLTSSEPLMYVNINILGNKVKALVDGGATRSFMLLL